MGSDGHIEGIGEGSNAPGFGDPPDRVTSGWITPTDPCDMRSRQPWTVRSPSPAARRIGILCLKR